MLYKRRVQFYDTDAQGIVHHSNYFRYFEEARGEFLRSLGLPYKTVREKGYEVVLLEACCNFKKPLLYDELVEIELSLEELDRFTFSFVYLVSVGGELRAEGRTKHCMVKGGKIVSVPQEIKDKLLTEIKA
ncbi:acyl-CoA thioester hydrolase [Hydrogenivirga caldilitoris]|uniref:Acyl-CoA thioester hydrolase n=1 Tax=Hydrogenivirga caldilitoris TaxID=246264 RepID=A0A497XQ81_9AQUI|nr:thioesterase family protein [Hydrogenivirga caldilitoris]RLJ70289.1 acyl-CoA thioester hydrolase [Hydrogenivirga caldilitoris]